MKRFCTFPLRREREPEESLPYRRVLTIPSLLPITNVGQWLRRYSCQPTIHAGRAVLVTGSSSGIGAAVAAELDRRGFRVFAGVRSSEDGKRLQTQASPRLQPLLLDITDGSAIAAAATTLQRELGDQGLFGLVNNAGIAVGGPLEIVPLDEVRRQFEVNVIGTLAVIQAMLPLLRIARGRIVNISSANERLRLRFSDPMRRRNSRSKRSATPCDWNSAALASP